MSTAFRSGAEENEVRDLKKVFQLRSFQLSHVFLSIAFVQSSAILYLRERRNKVKTAELRGPRKSQ